MSDVNKRTCLYEEHVKAGARIVPFGGYEMPVQYTGVMAEAAAVRQHAGMFDVSHMARLSLKGERVLEFLEHVTSNDVAKLKEHGGQYSLLPNFSGGVVDDIIVYRLSDGDYALVVNASNHEKDFSWLNGQNSFGVKIEDQTIATCMIAVQGPKAAQLLAEHSEEPSLFLESPLFGVHYNEIGPVPVFAARSGYTGEDGFELVCDSEVGPQLWETLLGLGVVPCGLGSRDTLRVEAGLPLYGHELEDNISPIEAGLGWVVSKTKAFIGSEIINQVRMDGPSKRLVGLQLSGKRLMTAGSAVYFGDSVVGTVSSGVVSPLLGVGIGMAFLDNSVKIGTEVEVDMRGKREPVKVVSKRFLADSKKIGA